MLTVPLPWHAALSVGALAVVTLVAARPVRPTNPDGPAAAALRCTLMPGRTLALLRVETDTTLPFESHATTALSATIRPASAQDTLLATPGTPMPAARVRLLDVDPTTRAALRATGITDAEPHAYIRAAPYRADCRTIRWTDSLAWVQPGDVGYVRATLAPAEHWVDGVPVLVIPDSWDYPFPRQRGLVFRVPRETPLAPAAAVYGLHAALEAPVPGLPSAADRPVPPSGPIRRLRAIAWARANPAAVELEPVRALLRGAVLGPDRDSAVAMPSRLRGTYRVTLVSGETRVTWFYRTYDRPTSSWLDADTVRSTADILASPHVAGYQLVGYVAGARDSLPTTAPRYSARPVLAWLAASDRPTAPGNAARRVLAGAWAISLENIPGPLWDALETLVPPQDSLTAALMARVGPLIPRGKRQPVLPLTLRLDAQGGVRADTTLVVAGRSVRLSLVRLDTVAAPRPF